METIHTMSKRKNRTGAPNLSQETLERARRQAAIDRGEIVEEPAASVAQSVTIEPAAPKPAPPAGATAYRAAPRERRSSVDPRTGARRPRAIQMTGDKNRAEIDAQQTRELLDNPTKVVTEAELRRDYGYVLADLRNMGMLAAGLIVALVILAQLLPR